MRREWCLICTEKIYMNCNRCQILLEQLLDGQLDAAMEAEVLAHVECCVSCAHWRRDLQRVWELLDAEKSLEPSPGFVVRTIRRAVTVNESPTLLLPRRIFWPAPRRLWAMASAGAMVLVVLSGYWLLRQTAGPPEIVTGVFAEFASFINETSSETFSGMTTFSALPPLRLDVSSK